MIKSSVRFLILMFLWWLAVVANAQPLKVGSVITNLDGSVGVVFYIHSNGQGGWMVALEDASTGCAWGNSTDIPGVANQDPGGYFQQLLNDTAGYSNTETMRDYQNANSNYAAGVVDFAHGWVLPSPAQLRMLYGQLPFITVSIVNAGGVSLSNDYYWCSAENDASKAWCIDFGQNNSCGGFKNVSKSTICHVRAVRSFSNTSIVYDTSLTYLWNTGSTQPYINVSPTQTTTYTVTGTTDYGCSNTVEQTIIVGTGAAQTIYDTICGGTGYEANGFTIMAEETSTPGQLNRTRTLETAGCSSTLTLQLTVKSPVTSTNSATGYGSYTWNGVTYYASGEYTQTFTAANGCDSVATLQLTIKNCTDVLSVDTVIVCDSYVWNDSVYTVSGDYTQTFMAANGCDSIVTLALTIISCAMLDNVIDADCTLPPDSNAFAMTELFKCPNVNSMSTPMVADMDGDGLPEIIACCYTSSAPYYNTGFYVVNGQTGALKYTLNTVQYSNSGLMATIADVDHDGKSELFLLGADHRLYCYNYNGVVRWSSANTIANNYLLSAADVNNDGVAEIVCGEYVYDAQTGVLLLHGAMVETGMGFGAPHGVHLPYFHIPYYMYALGDVDGDETLELCAGNTIYKMVITNNAGTTGNSWSILRQAETPGVTNKDGQTFLVDFDKDGDFDVCVIGITHSLTQNTSSHTLDVYVWDGQTSQMIAHSQLFVRNKCGASIPYSGDLNGDGYPEIIFNSPPGMMAYTYDTVSSSMSLMHSYAPFSETAGFTVFDFNQDGRNEIVYRGATQLYIVDGVTLENLCPPITAYSGTITEYPIVADVNADGQAEIIVARAYNNWNSGGGANGWVSVYGSQIPGAWSSARKVWNQWAYSSVNINEDMTVPQYRFDVSTTFPNGKKPFNAFLHQMPYIDTQGDLFNPVADVIINEISASSNVNTVTLTLNCCNIGDFTLSAPYPVTVFANTYGGEVIHTATVMESLPVDSCTQIEITLAKSLLCGVQNLESLWVAVNCAGTGIAQNGNLQPECDTTNNVYSVTYQLQPVDPVEVAVSVCDSYEWNGTMYTESGSYTQTFTAANGCDSVVTLELTIIPPPELSHTPDTVILTGTSANLWASGTDVLYWTDSSGNILASGSSLTVSPQTSTLYYLTGQNYSAAVGNNLVVNGDFEQGNVGLTSEYAYSSYAYEGAYYIGYNGRSHYPSFATWFDHTSGSGLYMIVNGAGTPNSNAWTQSVEVEPNTDYAFSAWICNLSPRAVATGNLQDVSQLQFSVNGTQLGDIFYVPETAGWTSVYEVWNSGNNTTATITVLNQNSEWAGNDFGLDDISFTPLTACSITDSILVHVTGYPDNVDSADCTVFSTGHDWGIVQDWASAEMVSPLVIPLVGDIDGDQVPEIICLAPNDNYNYYGATKVMVFNTLTHQLVHTIDFPERISTNDAAPYGIIKLPNGHVILVVALVNNTMHAYDLTSMGTTPLWSANTSSHYGPNVSFADFNGDSYPEIVIGNQIYDAETGTLLISNPSVTNSASSFAHHNSTPAGHIPSSLSSPCVANMVGDYRPDLILGNEIYEVLITNRYGLEGNSITLSQSITPPAGVSVDGHPQVADFNLDGHLDVFVSNKSSQYASVGCYVWDVYNNTVSEPLIISANESGKSIPLIADIDNDDALEIVIQCRATSGEKVKCYKYNAATSSFSFMWDIYVNEDSYSNSMSVFDFNNDGQNDLLISDQTTVRIVNGSGHSHFTGNDTIPVYVLTSLSFGECTVMQYPVVADVDADGSAELVVLGRFGSGHTYKAYLNIFKSAGIPWAPARKVWNQYMYNVTNVNEDLTIPQYLFNNATAFTDPEGVVRRPFNNFLQQGTTIDQYGRPFYAVPDVAVNQTASVQANGDSLLMSFSYCNIGDNTLNAPYTITVFANAYGEDTVCTVTMNESLPVDSCANGKIRVPVSALCAAQAFDSLVIAVNCAGAGIAQNGNLQPECDTTNNTVAVAVSLHSDTTILPVFACDSYTWNGTTYIESGDYVETFHAVNGCDSVVMLQLTIIPLPELSHTPDTVIIAGTSANLWAAGADVLVWMDNDGNVLASGPSLTVSPETSTMYYLTGQHVGTSVGNNLVVNGDFEQGNVNFTSDYTYITGYNNMYFGRYSITSDGLLIWGEDHLYGNGGMGQFMVVDGATAPNSRIWQQTVSVMPNTYYAFSAQIASTLHSYLSGAQALLQFSINDIQLGDVFHAPDVLNVWQPYYEVWYSGDNTSAILTILNQNNNGAGNDFGLDDIVFAPLTECSVTDSILVHVMGYPDNVDSADCVFFPEGTEWSISQPIISNVGNAVIVSTPMVGDVDDDGQQEIVIPSSTNSIASRLNIYNSDGILKSQFNIAGTYIWNSVGLAKVKWDNSSYKTIIVVFGTNNYLYAYDATGTQLWQSNQPFSSHNGEGSKMPAISFADFNHDGWGEVFVGSEIFDAATGVLLCKTNGNKGGADRTWSWGNTPYQTMAANLCGDSRLELAVGNAVYDVDIQSRTDYSANHVSIARQLPSSAMIMEDGSQIPFVDGNTFLADINLDGSLDVVVMNMDGINRIVYLYVWDIATNSIICTKKITNARKFGTPQIGDLDNDTYPEICFITGTYSDHGTGSNDNIHALKYNPNNSNGVMDVFWSIPHEDNSGSTGLTMFDFNQDGYVELVYRDVNNLRIINGSLRNHQTGQPVLQPYDLAFISCHSATGVEYPVVADVDLDGEVEIVVGGETYPTDYGHVYIFKSAGIPWAPARKVWNQYMYNVTNVNEDLTIPQYLFNNATAFTDPEGVVRRPFNNFLQQGTTIDQYGRPFYAVPDVAVNQTASLQANGDSLRLSFSYFNLGDNTLNAPYTITVFANAYGGDTVCTVTMNESLPVDSCTIGEIRVPVGVLCTAQAFDSLVIAVNCAGAGIAQNGNLQPECDTTNNTVAIAFSLHTDTTHVTETACDTFDWYEHMGITQSGDYTHVFTNAAGCDSTVIMHLTVFQSTHNVLDTTICESFTWTDGDGETYTISGTYTYDYTNTEGCASTDTLHLTIIPLPELSHTSDTVILTGTSATLWTSGADVLYWTDSSGNILASGSSLTVSPVTSTMYYLVGQNQGDCSAADSIHVHVTGYPDNVDSANCTVFSTGHDWGIDLDWSSAEMVSPLVIPLVGDIDGDEIPEIICFAPNYSYSFYGVTDVKVYNTITHQVVHTFNLPHRVSTIDASPYGIIKLPNGHVVFVAAMMNNTMQAYDITAMGTTPLWTVSTPYEAPNIGFADFNSDSYPEIYMGNRIYDAETGALLLAGTAGGNEGVSYAHAGEHKLPSPFVSNVAGDFKPDLILGNEVYDITITNRNGMEGNSMSLLATIAPPQGVPADGHPQVADFNFDGHLDVLISNKNSAYDNVYCYVWDIFNNTVSNALQIPTSSSGKSIPLIADVDNDDVLEMVIQCGASSGNKVKCYKYNAATSSFSFMWDIYVNEDSYSNSMSVFDLNNDGTNDLLISDQTTVRIVNGSGRSHLTGNDTIPVYVLSSLSFGECTVMQYPVVADVDADGSAELVFCGRFGAGHTYQGYLNVFKSATTPWAPARKVWNQYMYNVTNVNEDLTIPQFQFNNATAFTDPEGVVRRPFNNFLQQGTTIDQYGRPFYAVPDVAVNQTASVQANGDSLLLSFSYCNLGDNTLNAPYPVTVFANTYGGDMVCTVTINESLPVDSCMIGEIKVPVGVLCAAQPIDSLVIAVNCAGAGIAQNGNLQPECDTTNNMVTIAFSMHTDTTHVTETACDTFDWYEHVGITQSGDYTHVFTNATGCDSTVIMHLTVFQSTHNVLDTTICESYIWTEGDGETYTISGTYTYDYSNTEGCASTDTLHLTIIPLPELSHTPDTVILTGTSATLWASGSDVLYWTDSSGNILASGSSLTVSPVTSTMYYLVGQNQGDCSTTDSVYVHVTGYPDNVMDKDCVFPPDSNAFEMMELFKSPDVNSMSTPMVADMDGDGLPEIVVSCYTYNAPWYSSGFHVLNGQTGNLKYTISTVQYNNHGQSMTIADVDHDGKAELFLLGIDGHLYCYNFNGGTRWMSSNTINENFLLSAADVNNDGNAEIVCGKYVYNAQTGVLLLQGNMLETGMGYGNPHSTNSQHYYMYALGDVDGNGSLELCAGNAVYKMEIVNLSGTSGNSWSVLRQATLPNSIVNKDGQTFVVDFDNDGDIDICVIGLTHSLNYSSSHTIDVYVWDGQTSQLIAHSPLHVNSSWGASIPYSGDLNGDGYPEIIFAITDVGMLAYTYDTVSSTMSLMHNHAPFGETAGFTVFDFNQDGRNEIVYRGTQQLYIVDGVTLENLNVPITAYSGTVTEYPVVADVNADGHAEIIVTRAYYDWESSWNANGWVAVYGSQIPGAWSSARKVWNQWAYNSVNINEDMTVPQYRFDVSTTFPNGKKTFNAFLHQMPYIDSQGDLFNAVPDVVVNSLTSLQLQGDTLQLSISYCNLGDNTLNAPYPVTVFANTYGGDTVCTFTIGESLPVDSCMIGEIRVPVGALCAAQPFDSLVIAVNCAGAGIAQNGNLQPECDTTNNTVTTAFSLHADTTHVTETACDTFDWYEHVGITQSGDYIHVFTNSTGCDSTVIMHLTVFQSTHNVLDTTVCESFTWTAGTGETYTVSDTYTHAYTNVDGCASTDTLHLTILHGTHHVLDTTICESFTWNEGDSATYTTSGTYTYDYTNADGCASTDTLHLTILHGTHHVLDTTVCESFTWTDGTGETYTMSDTYTHAYTNAEGCASTDTLHLTVRPLPVAIISGPSHLCEDSSIVLSSDSAASYQWNTGETTQSIVVHEEGTYTLVVTDEFGCSGDTSLRVSASYNPILEVNIPGMCAGGSYTISVGYQNENNVQLGHGSTTLSMVDTVFLPDGVPCEPHGCSYRSPLTFSAYGRNEVVESVEDIYYVRLNMEHSWAGDIYINITCPNGQKADIMKYGGSGISTCNSSIVPASRGWQSGSNASVGSYFGEAYDIENGSDICNPDAVGNEQGVGWNYCWSNNNTQGYVYAPGDGSLVYRSENEHSGILDSSNVTAGTHFYHPDQSFSSLIGCPLNGSWYIEVIDGWDVDNGYIFGWELSLRNEVLSSEVSVFTAATSDGPWITSLNDSLFRLDPPADLTQDTVISYTFHIFDDFGCQYDTTVEVLFFAPRHTIIDTVSCDAIVWNGVQYAVSGSYSDTLMSSHGCDSVVTLNLTINQCYIEENVDTIVCVSAMPYTWHGHLFAQAGEWIDTVVRNDGFFLVTTYQLSVSNPAVTEMGTSQVACFGGSDGQVQVLVSGGVEPYNCRWENAAGTTVSTTAQLTNQPAGTYTLYISDDIGCTATQTVSLTHLSDSMVAGTIPQTQAVCMGNTLPLVTGTVASGGVSSAYQWQISTNGVNWDAASTPNNSQNYNYPNTVTSSFFLRRAWISQACGTVYSNVMSVTVLPVYADTIQDMVCQGYSYQNNGFNISETETAESNFIIRTRQLQSSQGCDSSVTLLLTVMAPQHTTITDGICLHSSYQANGFDIASEQLATAGEYTFEQQYVVNNCDSVVTLHLTVYPEYEVNLQAVVCEGDGYYQHGFNVPAVQTIGVDELDVTQNLQSQHNCDSVVNLHLTVMDTSIAIVSLTEDFCEEYSADLSVVTDAMNYVWNTGETTPVITVTQPGMYTVTATQENCSISAWYQIQQCEFNVYLPNAITPGLGDGINDYFCIHDHYKAMIEDFEIRIYSRWGELVYYSDDKDFKWNGEIKGRIIRQVIYTYLITFTDKRGIPHQLTGNITVM